MNAVVPLIMPSASCDDIGANGVTWSKCFIAPHFHYLDLTNTLVPFSVLLMNPMPVPVVSHDQRVI